MKKWLLLLLALLMCALPALGEVTLEGDSARLGDLVVVYQEDYSDPDSVALYLHAFRELPPNYLTKAEARARGWVSSEGNLWEVAWGMSIGGDVFGNREGLLPDDGERVWRECDVNYYGGFRGGERVVYGSDGLIYYSDDHYGSFVELYDGWYEEESGDWLDWLGGWLEW